jgi:hypothetical protein
MPGRENVSPSPYELPKDASVADLLRQVQRLTKLSIRTHAPATVLLYDPVRQLVDCTVDHLLTVKVVDETQAARLVAQGAVLEGVPPNATATLPPIRLTQIPVAWPRTIAGYVTFPLVPGDTGELHVSDRSLAQWRLLGAPADPKLAETHSLADSVFHPGLTADTAPIVPPTDLTATVVQGPQVKLGPLAASPVAKGTELIAAVDAALAAAIAAIPGPPDAGARAFTAFQVAWNASKTAILSPKALTE